MAWSRFEDDLDENPKVAEMSDKAYRLWTYSITFSTRNRSSGYLTAAQVRGLSAKVGAARKHVDELLRLRGWEGADGGVRIHDYPVYHPKDPTAADRQKAYRERNIERFGNPQPKRYQPVTQPSLKRDEPVTRSYRSREHPNPESRIPIPPYPPSGVTANPKPDPEARGEGIKSGNGARPNPEPTGLWARVVARLELSELDRKEFKTWFGPPRERGIVDGKLVVEVPSKPFAEWIPRKYGPDIELILGELVADPPRLVLEVAS